MYNESCEQWIPDLCVKLSVYSNRIEENRNFQNVTIVTTRTIFNCVYFRAEFYDFSKKINESLQPV